ERAAAERPPLARGGQSLRVAVGAVGRGDGAVRERPPALGRGGGERRGAADGDGPAVAGEGRVRGTRRAVRRARPMAAGPPAGGGAGRGDRVERVGLGVRGRPGGGGVRLRDGLAGGVLPADRPGPLLARRDRPDGRLLPVPRAGPAAG